MSKGLIAKVAKAIGYPQEIPAEAVSFDFLVDGNVITAEEQARGLDADNVRILLKTVLTRDEEACVRLAAYAAGRLLKEEVTLAWDPESHSAILWILVTADGEGHLRRAFEAFCTSVDWWLDRVKEEVPSHSERPEMTIRP